MPQAWFPRPLQIIHNGATFRFEAGMQEVPEAMSSHWWLQENGVTFLRRPL